MGRLLVILMCLATGSLLLLAGCSSPASGFGNRVPEPQQQLSGVRILEVTSAPGGLMFVGETSVFTVVLSEPVSSRAVTVSVQVGDKDSGYRPEDYTAAGVTFNVSLSDAGEDGCWIGKHTWSDYGVPLYGLPVTARLQWRYGGPGAELSGGTITVLPREEEE